MKIEGFICDMCGKRHEIHNNKMGFKYMQIVERNIGPYVMPVGTGIFPIEVPSTRDLCMTCVGGILKLIDK